MSGRVAHDLPIRDRHACSIAEACQYSGRGRTELYKLLQTGDIRSVKAGRRRLVLVASLVEYFERVDGGA